MCVLDIQEEMLGKHGYLRLRFMEEFQAEIQITSRQAAKLSGQK